MTPRPRLDPLALVVHGVGLVVVLGVVAFVGWQIASRPKSPEPAVPERGMREAISEVQRWIEEQRSLPARAKPAPPPSPTAYPLEAGHTWRYSVVVDPPVWRDIMLTYRTVQQGGQLGVTADMRHAGGSMNFNLGVFAAGHPTHANVRFPGFFFYPSYFERPLEVGQRLAWQWPWQLPGGQVKNGRVKRYSGEVKEWVNLQVPAGIYSAARIEATLSYVEDGRVAATAAETIWYMPKLLQVAKVVRQGRTPDEGATRIVAELVEVR